jgi:hypothetical protein
LSRRAGALHRQSPPTDFPPGIAARSSWLTLR